MIQVRNFLVSVVTPTFNSIKYVDRVVDCVNQQTLGSVEHIIIDDGSTDGTLEYLREIADRVPHLTILSQQHFGAGAARNAGIKVASGRYVAFLDCDDYWSPEKLEIQISFMMQNNVVFSYGDYSAVDAESGRVVAKYGVPDKLSYANLLRGCQIGCLTVAYDQKAAGKTYMPLVRRGQDWGLWLALTRDGLLARKYPGNFAIYSRNSKSLSKNKLKKIFDIYRIYIREEKIGYVRSIFYLSLHVKNAFSRPRFNCG